MNTFLDYIKNNIFMGKKYSIRPIFIYKNQHNLRTKVFFFSLKKQNKNQKRPYFFLKNHFIPLKYQDFGEEEVEIKNQKSLFKSVKNISVLNVAFSKSVLVLIKNGCNLILIGYIIFSKIKPIIIL